jgi:hypothetical protein
VKTTAIYETRAGAAVVVQAPNGLERLANIGARWDCSACRCYSHTPPRRFVNKDPQFQLGLMDDAARGHASTCLHRRP